MTDAVIGHVSACEVKEQPISMCTDSLSETIKDPSIKKLKARAESVLKYCMEKDAANAEKRKEKHMKQRLIKSFKRWLTTWSVSVINECKFH